LSQRPAARRYAYGYGRVEDIAGLLTVIKITLSALLAGYKSSRRVLSRNPSQTCCGYSSPVCLGSLATSYFAMYRIRVGRQIESAALIADGIHARTDGFTSLAVVFGVIGIWLGFPSAYPDRRVDDQHRHLRVAVGHRPQHWSAAAGRRRP
jgi:divalent metal cation (Fe/Co/Zn/Cd) transporter